MSPPAVANGKPRAWVFDASYVAVVHTALASAAFTTALLLACLLHYKKIVKNGVAQYPDEWWPSVSATIGDWYPERNVFHILIGMSLTSGPRIALVVLQYYLAQSSSSSLPVLVLVSGLIRTLSCGGWVYVTSNDDHDVHDVLMITYIVFNIPWMFGGIACTPSHNVVALRRRRVISTLFFASIVPLVYFFIQHKVHRIPGAYTYYSFFEWALIAFDVMFDSVAELDFKAANLQISLGSLGIKEASAQKQSTSVVSTGSATTIVNKKITPEIQRSQVKDTSQSITSDSRTKLRFNIPSGWRPAISFSADVYLSYIFWSIFTSLVPTLFFFSVWELAIAGSELALLSTLSPVLLAIPPLQRWCRTRTGQTALHALSFLGLAAYALETPMQRLLVVAFATAVLILRQVVSWTDVDGNGVGYQGILMGLGLIVSSLSKHANHSNNPVWPMVNESSGGYNKIGLGLAMLALFESHTRPSQPAKRKVPVSAQPESEIAADSKWLPAAVALGSLIFSLHCLLADSSTLIAWSWTGYADRRPRGPQPHLHGSITLIAQSIGLLIPILLSSQGHRVLTHPLWFAYGVASAFTMYQYRNWLGYIGGANLAVFLMSIIPQVLHGAAVASQARMVRTFFTALLVTCLLDLANVWTVAYAFVPGGVYLRERTDLVVIAQMLCLGLAFKWPNVRKTELSWHLPGSTGSYSRTLLALLSVSSVAVTIYRLPSSPPQPHSPGPRILTAGIWTVHFGIDNQGRDSQRRIRDLVRDMKLDVVGLLETDLHRIVYGNRDLTRVLIEESGYYVDIGPGPNSHTWGAVLLSKYPIINTTHHLLPSPHGELAPAIEAYLDVYGTEVQVVIAHNGQEEDPLDRELQARELARIMAKTYPNPTIFLGYVVTKPWAAQPAPYDIMVTDGRTFDVDPEDGDRWCEYIFYRSLYRTAYARVSRGVVTDTEMQIAQFTIPKYGVGVTNDTKDARMLRSFKEDLPEYHWFPMEYYGDENGGGKNGHFYHVFYT